MSVAELGFDVDGVAADFTGAMLEAIGTDVKPEDIKEWAFKKFLTEEEGKRADEVMKDMDFWLNLPVIDGAKQKIRALKSVGYTIIWITSPWPTCPEWEDARRDWVMEHFGDDPVVVTKEKWKVGTSLLVDDKPDNIEQWKEHCPDKKVFLFDAPYNRDYHGAPRVDWNSIERIL